MSVVVCLPDRNAVDLLGALPDGVEVITWDGGDEHPPGLDRTEFWVPQLEEPMDLGDMRRVMPRLAVVQLTSAGSEDITGRVPGEVTLCTARGVHGPAVAELVLAMILSLQRRLPDFQDQQRRRHWELLGADDLRDKRVVIVGAGDLGEQTAVRLRSFDAVPVLVASSARDGVHATDELPDLLPDADMVVLTVPLTPATEGMVDAAFLARLPDHAIVVNVARGRIVDTAALLAELQSGRLRAGLDVVEPEPLPEDHPLWAAPNLILTPHAAGNVARSGERAFALVADQLRRHLAGEPLVNVVDD